MACLLSVFKRKLTMLWWGCTVWLYDYILDSKFHGANMGPIWGRQGPGGSYVGPTNFAIWYIKQVEYTRMHILIFFIYPWHFFVYQLHMDILWKMGKQMETYIHMMFSLGCIFYICFYWFWTSQYLWSKHRVWQWIIKKRYEVQFVMVLSYVFANNFAMMYAFPFCLL